jgi:hypothetical protein
MRTLALLLLCTACTRSPPVLDGVRMQPPIYPGSKLDMDDEPFGGFMGAGDHGEIDGRFWYFVTKDPPEKIVEFYKAQLTGAELKEFEAEGAQPAIWLFHWVPAGYDPYYDEGWQFRVPKAPRTDGKTRFNITQSVRRINH